MERDSAVACEFGLAPMEGVSELPFRLWIGQTSAPPFASTPFLRATDSYPRLIPSEFAPELDTYRDFVSYSLIPQVMASRPEDFVRTARLFLERDAWVDLNAGCPSPNPISGGAGSGLLKDPLHFTNFMQSIADGLPPGRFSLKMRTGFEDTSHFFTLLDALKNLPLQRLTIHGRTRRDRYDHSSRWDLIAAASEQLNIPVVASGDIVSYPSWLERAPLAGKLKSVIIGRGALRNPWIFSELRSGASQSLTLASLKHSLACLGLWFEAFHINPSGLDALIRSGCFRSAALCDDAHWEELYKRSVKTLRGNVLRLDDLDFERAIMGRLKMVWNYFRSSLPQPFFSPQLLRASHFNEWITAWGTMWDEQQPLPLVHTRGLDWLYTSSRKKDDVPSVRKDG